MTIHQAQLPKVVADYASWQRHPVVHQTFIPGRGWKRYPFNKRISGAWARKLRAENVTVVALTDGVRVADFNIKELTNGGVVPWYPKSTI